jgi:hypothetical protein
MHECYCFERYYTGRGRASYKHVPGLARTLREGALLQMYVTKSDYKASNAPFHISLLLFQRKHVCSSIGSSVSAH